MNTDDNPSEHRRLVGCLAVAVLCVGLIAAVLISRWPLASETMEFADGNVVAVTLRNNRGRLSLDLDYRDGGSLSRWIGDESEFGAQDPKLWYDPTTDLVHARIGRGKWEFDRFGDTVRFEKSE